MMSAAVLCSVHDHLIFIRLRSAAFELLSTDDSVTEIALRSGFSDSNYLKDVFKRNTASRRGNTEKRNESFLGDRGMFLPCNCI